MPSPLVSVAHRALSLSEPPYLKHYRRGRFATERGVALTGSVLPGPGFNFAACLGDVPPLAEVVEIAERFYAAEDEWGVLVEGDAGHPIEDELRANEWVVAEDEPAFVMPELPRAAPPLPGLELRVMRTADDLRTFRRIAAAAFGTTDAFADQMMPMLGLGTDPDMHWLIGDWHGEPASVGGHCRVGPTAVVCCLATLPDFRGKGIGAALTRALLADAAAKGMANAALRSGPLSVPLYERVGFQYACQHRTYGPRKK